MGLISYDSAKATDPRDAQPDPFPVPDRYKAKCMRCGMTAGIGALCEDCWREGRTCGRHGEMEHD